MPVKELNLRSAFTTTSDTIKKRLINNSKVWVDGRECVAQSLWDTGATNSCISINVVRNLALHSIGQINVQTPTGEETVDLYLVNITLPNDIVIENTSVCGSKIADQGIDLLIGMDIISRGDFVVTNRDGKTLFSFCTPSVHTIDFAKEIAAQNVVGKPHGKGHRKRHK